MNDKLKELLNAKATVTIFLNGNSYTGRVTNLNMNCVELLSTNANQSFMFSLNSIVGISWDVK